MNERILRVVEDHTAHGMRIQIVETLYEFGRHYVTLVNGMPDYHSVDLERVQAYVRDLVNPR